MELLKKVWYLKLIVFLKGFHIYENLIETGNSRLIQTYHFELNTGQTIAFKLYRVDYEAYQHRFWNFKKVKHVNYVLHAEFDPTLPERILKFNRMSLRSFDLFVDKDNEPIFLQIVSSAFIKFIRGKLRFDKDLPF
jgi:hypothetical protein